MATKRDYARELEDAGRERNRIIGLLGERLGMFAKLREQNRIIKRLEKRVTLIKRAGVDVTTDARDGAGKE